MKALTYDKIILIVEDQVFMYKVPPSEFIDANQIIPDENCKEKRFIPLGISEYPVESTPQDQLFLIHLSEMFDNHYN